MLRYTINRLASLVPLLFGLSLASFLYVHLTPGDPVAAMLGPAALPGQVEEMRHALGLDRPLLDQYVEWLQGALQGDLGITFVNRQKLTPILIDRIPATVELALGGMFVAVIIGLPAGFFAALKKNSKVDYFFSLMALGGLSMPVFWFGTLLLLYFGVSLRILPTGGYIPFTEDPALNLKYLIMPAVSTGFGVAPFIARMTRTTVIETLQEPFVAYAWAKGLRQRIVLVNYVLRHAICQIVVVLALNVGNLISGSILIEQLFLWPGMGRVTVGAVQDRDYYVIQACILIYAGLFFITNLAADLIHAWLDPRIQLK
jgi:peptide/nickel transport system permease protein